MEELGRSIVPWLVKHKQITKALKLEWLGGHKHRLQTGSIRGLPVGCQLRVLAVGWKRNGPVERRAESRIHRQQTRQDVEWEVLKIEG